MADKVDLKKEDFVFEDDSGDWKPLPPEITAQGGREPTAQEIYPIEAVDPLTGQTINQKHKKFSELSPQEAEARGIPVSTITGHPEATAKEKLAAGKEAAATTMRYVPPIVAGIATGGLSIPEQLAIGGLTAGLSEITARQIERAGTDPELDSIWNDLKAGGAATAIDVAVGAASHGLMRGVTAAGRRLLLPRSMPPDVELAHTILGRIENPAAAAKWYQFWKKSQPFGLSLDQLNTEERGFVSALIKRLGGIAEGGTGGGIMKKARLRNTEIIEETLDDYFKAAAVEKSGPEFGAFIKRVIGDVDEPGESFKAVEAYKAFLYDLYDDALIDAAVKVNLEPVRKLLEKSRRPEFLKVYKAIRSPLLGGDSLLPKVVKGDWSAIPAQDVDKILRSFGDFYKLPPEKKALSSAANQMREKISEIFEQSLGQAPRAKQYRDTANAFFGARGDALYTAQTKSLWRSIAIKPSGVAALMDFSKGAGIGGKYDQLMQLKKTLYFSAATPSKTLTPEWIAKEGYKSVDELWEKSVLAPLRFKFIDGASDSYGRLNPAKLVKEIENVQGQAKEALVELFGSQKQVDFIKEFALTYDSILKNQTEKSVFIQLKTAAAIGAGGGYVWSMFNGDSPTASATVGAGVGALTILISPNVLARTLANPRLTRALTDGLRSSGGGRGISTTLAMTFRKMSEMKAASSLFRDSPSSDVMQFYNFAPIEEVPGNEPVQ